MIPRFARLSACALSLIAGTAFAQPVLVNSNLTVSPTDTTILGVPLATAQITVQGATLTMSGRHTIASLNIERSGPVAGVLTHFPGTQFDYSGVGTDIVQGLELTVTGNVTVQGSAGGVASRIDMNGRGYPERQGPGTTNHVGGAAGSGAGHGGSGTNGSGVVGGNSVGSFASPTMFGSGGSGNCCTAGSAGGGRVQIFAGGVMTIDGTVSADAGVTAGNVSGGAGGSVWLRALSITGSGSVSAKGLSAPAGWGAGGGGRIRLDNTGLPAIPSISADARGGSTPTLQAGAGSIARAGTVGPSLIIRELVFDNFSSAESEVTEIAGTVDVPGAIIVRGGAVVGPFANDDTLHLIGRTDVQVLANSAISADGRGFPERLGPGTSSNVAGASGAGAGHGGAGADGLGAVGGDTYGSITQPITKGSGGTGNCCTPGSAGGGVVRVTSNGNFTLNGRISANGETFASPNNGGGAGGSVWLTVDPTGAFTFAVSPSASITAKGSNSGNEWGGGGGGRIAIYAPVSIATAAGPIANAAGGLASSGNRRGGAGTIYLDNPGAGGPPGALIIDNKTTAPDGETTELTGGIILDAGLIVRGGGIVGPKAGDDTLHISLSSNVTIEADGQISASKRGFAERLGPGTASNVSGGGGAGAGHGGAGGGGSSFSGGDTYGSFLNPITMGSGGSGNCCVRGGFGGGVIRLTTTGSILNNGAILADAENGSTTVGGGGAGGSIWVTCGAFSGSGIVTAHGGDGQNFNWGGGGGGRIAVTATSLSTPLTNFRAFGGTGFVHGGAGTVWIKPTSAAPGTLFIRNNGVLGEATEMTGPVAVPGNIVIDDAGLLAPKHADATLHVIASGDVAITSDGVAGADLRGFGSATGPGSGVYVGGAGGFGAGHGGAGENGLGAPGGDTYGSFLAPTTMGSGGSGNCCVRGGFGGGAFALNVGGNLIVDGRLSANAENGASGNGGGGSGGSLRIGVSGQLQGSGTIEARGGNGLDNNWGNGGGGRVSVVTGSNTNPFPLANFNLGGGTTGTVPGGAGTLFIKQGLLIETLVIDNDGALNGESTEMTGEVVVNGNLLVTNGGILGPKHQDDTLSLLVNGNVTVDSAGQISSDIRGYPGREGPGSVAHFGGGAGGGGAHGGDGGTGTNAPGGLAYGDAANPVTMGSGGGGNCCVVAGAGGGVVRIFSSGSVHVDGVVSSNGQGGSATNTGGGAGGSVVIRAGLGLSGAGFVRADGGSGQNNNFGGGGGGRVAIYACNITMPLSNITSNAGSGGVVAAQAGSVYFGSGSINITQQPESQIVVQGGSLQLAVVASSTLGPVTYQWRRFGIPVLEGDYDGRATGTMTSTLLLSSVDCFVEGNFDCLITDSCGSFPTNVAIVESENNYNDIDYNNDGLFPDDTDLVDFLTVLAGGPCSTDPIPGCDTIDFNNDGLFPDDTDLLVFLRILAGGEC